MRRERPAVTKTHFKTMPDDGLIHGVLLVLGDACVPQANLRRSGSLEGGAEGVIGVDVWK